MMRHLSKEERGERKDKVCLGLMRFKIKKYFWS